MCGGGGSVGTHAHNTCKHKHARRALLHIQNMHAAILGKETAATKEKGRLKCSKRELSILSRIRCVSVSLSAHLCTCFRRAPMLRLCGCPAWCSCGPGHFPTCTLGPIRHLRACLTSSLPSLSYTANTRRMQTRPRSSSRFSSPTSTRRTGLSRTRPRSTSSALCGSVFAPSPHTHMHTHTTPLAPDTRPVPLPPSSTSACV